MSSDAAAATRSVRATESNLAKAEATLKDAERRLESVASRPASEGAQAARQPQALEQAETAKAKASTRVAELQAQLEAARAKLQKAQDLADRAGEEAKAATEAKESAAQAADEAARKAQPVSVFVSRKTQRLYVRKGNYPIYEGPVAIRDAQSPVGTFVFTALAPLGTSGAMRWNVLALYPDPTNIEPPAPEPQRRVSARYTDNSPMLPPASRRASARNSDPVKTDEVAAKAALDRVAFSQEALDIISEVALPGSSLIISDEGPSRETGRDTDFVVVMSGEPQGALKIRQREPMPMDNFGYGRSPFRGFPFWN
jgi:multidrug efflux pump subunit AcrA (membrane-fusion protein)